jgi:hypothetical protein
VPAKKKTVAKKAPAKKPVAKRPAASKAAKSPPTTKITHAKRIKERLHTTIRRTPPTVSESEFEQVTAGVLTVVAELAAETAEVFAELLVRIERIEARLAR